MLFQLCTTAVLHNLHPLGKSKEFHLRIVWLNDQFGIKQLEEFIQQRNGALKWSHKLMCQKYQWIKEKAPSARVDKAHTLLPSHTCLAYKIRKFCFYHCLIFFFFIGEVLTGVRRSIFCKEFDKEDRHIIKFPHAYLCVQSCPPVYCAGGPSLQSIMSFVRLSGHTCMLTASQDVPVLSCSVSD